MCRSFSWPPARTGAESSQQARHGIAGGAYFYPPHNRRALCIWRSTLMFVIVGRSVCVHLWVCAEATFSWTVDHEAVRKLKVDLAQLRPASPALCSVDWLIQWSGGRFINVAHNSTPPPGCTWTSKELAGECVPGECASGPRWTGAVVIIDAVSNRFFSSLGTVWSWPAILIPIKGVPRGPLLYHVYFKLNSDEWDIILKIVILHVTVKVTQRDCERMSNGTFSFWQ